ncbi:5'-3' exoribonuclease 1-like isoform X3 [Clytia hemisphaerica]|uniref:5'-3' exoribonuclease 2 n=1 Tax=Clytia hemisphaerica TaxID=252671 RepID=A0A7M5XDQ4_9CNID
MGVPKFYRWLSERYPCLSQVIKEHQIPEFDNLYLDMNGIIHPCSHPNDDDPHFRITEEQIFRNIFNYIEVLFRIIKPKKNFFMAVDGCAPRAKMNQQRSRRFRTAKEAENNIRKAQMKGQTLPKEERFDSNCITPGTEFMARLNNQLKYFVNMKISTDPMWQECTIYLSGHDVPGEGEHKVMDFIRYCKAQPGYDPNTRHCLYGLDADLIMLGLTSHEPHFALLREEVRFGKQAKRITKPEQQTFHLLHLSLLREYLEFEFGALKSKLHFQYDIENIIDDWILLGFLVGNDFVPHLPNFHINHDALPYLYGVYKDFLLTTDGYLHNGGYINLHRMKKFFEFLSKFDLNNFEEKYEDFKWLQSKKTGDMLEDSHQNNPRGTPNKRRGRHDSKGNSVGTENPYAALANVSGAFDDFSLLETPPKQKKKPLKISLDPEVDIEDMDEEEVFQLEFKQHKRHYYMEKFDMDIVEDSAIQKICLEYIRALQWIAHYYFNGLQSWSWYYPYHYAPFISDVANFIVQDLHFEIGHPFKPFEQLLAVLPSASRKLLPKAFQDLMVMDNSAIIDFYPPDFRTDLNGKQQEWEAVVLIPFIDETRLLRAMEECYLRLTDEEKERNSFGKCLKYTYDPNLNFIYPTSYPGVFEDVNRCKAHKEDIHREQFHLDTRYLKKGLMEGTQLDVYFPGFPTMRHLRHKSYLKKAGVKVFQYNSRSENTIVKLIGNEHEDFQRLAQSLVGQSAHVEWPYLVEAKVVSVANDSVKYFMDNETRQLTSELVEHGSYDTVKREMKSVSSFLFNRKGIDIGDCDVLVEAKLLLGKRYFCTKDGSVKLEREYSKNTSFYAAKTVVKNLTVHKSSSREYKTVQSLYPVGSTCFMMASEFYGCAGEVFDFEEETQKVRVALKPPVEPNYDDVIQDYDRLSVCYLHEHIVVQKLHISAYVLNRITGDLFIHEHEHESRSSGTNIGLKIKYSGRNKEAVGFARRVNDTWTFSPVTVDIVREYIDRFPEVFETLGRRGHKDNFLVSDFSKRKNFLGDVKGFLKSLPCNKTETVRCGSNVLDKPVIQRLNEKVTALKEGKKSEKVTKVKVKPNCIFRPTDQFGKLSPDPKAEFFLLDRVINVDKGLTVPLGLRGSVVGIYHVPIDENDQFSPTEIRYEVMFDEEFLGANDVRHVKERGYFMYGYSLLNLSYGERKLRKKDNTQPIDPLTEFKKRITDPSKTTGKSSTPNNKGPYRGRLGPNRDNAQQRTPEPPQYWLKDKYQSPRGKQSPHGSGHKSHGTGGARKKENTATPPTTTSGTDFLNMWKELKKEENQSTPQKPQPSQQQQTTPQFVTQSSGKPQESVDQDATTAIHQLLNINKTSQQPVVTTPPQSSVQQPIRQLLQRPQQPQTIAMLQQMQHPQQMVAMQQRMPQALYQPPTHQHPPAMVPGSALPPFMQPSMILLQCCNQRKLLPPNYLFTKHPEGFKAFISLDGRHISGQICPTQQQAMENVATIALQQLTGVATAFSPAFVQPVVQPPQPSLQQHQPQANYHMQRQPSPAQNNIIRQSQSDSNLSSTKENKTPLRPNPFVPHQVSVKNTKWEESKQPEVHGPPPPINVKAECDLKEMLGIQARSSPDPMQQSEGELKKMLGIVGKPSTSPQPPDSPGQDILKSIGVTRSSPALTATSMENQLTDDMKLMNLIGIKPNSSTSPPTNNVGRPLHQTASEPIMIQERPTQQVNIPKQSTAAHSSASASQSSSSPLLQTRTQAAKPSPSNSSRSSPALSTASSNRSQNSSPAPGNATKKPILLAPTFFGAKKK